jgi:predicted component of type VI protein secretion system
MRKTLALFVLLVAALGWSGCSSSSPDRGAAPADKTTTAPASPSTNTSSNTNANRASGGAPTGIKPPMKDEK